MVNIAPSGYNIGRYYNASYVMPQEVPAARDQ